MVATIKNRSDREILIATANAMSMTVDEVSGRFEILQRSFTEETRKIQSMVEAIKKLFSVRADGYYFDPDDGWYDFYNDIHRHRITGMSNVWRRSFYRRMGFCKSGFIGRCAKRRKGR